MKWLFTIEEEEVDDGLLAKKPTAAVCMGGSPNAFHYQDTLEDHAVILLVSHEPFEPWPSILWLSRWPRAQTSA